jgi:hypothetical protein
MGMAIEEVGKPRAVPPSTTHLDVLGHSRLHSSLLLYSWLDSDYCRTARLLRLYSLTLTCTRVPQAVIYAFRRHQNDL